MGGSEVRSRHALHAALALVLVACAGKSNGDRLVTDGASGSSLGGSGSGAGASGGGAGASGGGAGASGGSAGTSGESLAGNHSDPSGASGSAGGGAAGLGSSGIAGEGGAGHGGSSGQAGEGGLSGMAGSGGLAGTGGSKPMCQPYPTVNNDPACPNPGTLSSGVYVESACSEELSCEFLVLTGDLCTQPPRLVPYKCCGWGFSSGACPTLPDGQDPRCTLPIWQNMACTVEGLTCQEVVYENSSPVDFVCCSGHFQQGTTC